MNAINVIGLTLLGVFALLTFQKKSRQTSDYLLLGIQALLALLLIFEAKASLLGFTLVLIVPYYLIGAFALYVHSLLHPLQKISYKKLLYFVPGIIATGLVVVDQSILHSYSPSEVEVLCMHSNMFYSLIKKGFQIYSLVILVLLLRKIRTYQNSLRAHLSYIEPFQLKWLWHLGLIYLGVIVITIISYGAHNLGFIEGDLRAIHTIVDMSMIAGVCLCCYKGIRTYSREVYLAQQGETHLPTAMEEEVSQTEKYSHSSLTDEERENIFQQILSLFEKEEIYLQPKLSVQDLAEKLHITPHILSQTINEASGQPFYDFVNSYRVKYLQELLVDPEKAQFTILALGMESGFNSKASLNRIFKNHTGLTPSAYQRSHTSDTYPSSTPTQHSLG
ncbi:MAG: helix-turn-helix domain-containing protein [Bacteroidota bacterium]